VLRGVSASETPPSHALQVRPGAPLLLRVGGPVVAVLMLLSGFLDETISSHAPTRAEAADTIARGWLPAVLPASAMDIRETHDLDTNIGEGAFAFHPRDAASLRAALVATPAGAKPRRFEQQALAAAGFRFYRYETFEIAVDWERSRARFRLEYQ
jgi:hypothetical protein